MLRTAAEEPPMSVRHPGRERQRESLERVRAESRFPPFAVPRQQNSRISTLMSYDSSDAEVQ